MLNRFLVATVALSGLLGLVGCVDPRGNFDDFSDRVGTTDASTIDAPPSGIFPITGDFLLAVHPGFDSTNNPAFYIQFLANFTLVETGDTAVINGTMTFLCTCSACTERSLVADPIQLTNVPVAADGTFQTSVTGTLPGMANPLSCGDQPMDATMHAGIISADLLCGTVTGEAAMIDLVGSTFAAIRVTDTSPAALPAPLAGCPGAMPVDAGVDSAPPIDAPIDAPVEIDAPAQ